MTSHIDKWTKCTIYGYIRNIHNELLYTCNDHHILIFNSIPPLVTLSISNFYYIELQHELYMDQITPSIWLGQKRAAFDDEINTLQKHNIKGIVSIGYYQEWWQFRENPKHCLVNLENSPYTFITDYFEEIFKFINDILSSSDDASVLIHSDDGKSRGGAMVIAYLMKKYEKSYSETLNRVLLCRKNVMPNIGFQIQLRSFAKNQWNTTIRYSQNIIDIDCELQIVLNNLQTQVSRLQCNIRASQKIFVTFDTKDVNKKRLVRIGLETHDFRQYRKEWILLVFLCHQFQIYKIDVHKETVAILHILGEMYFDDLLHKFIAVLK